MNTAADIVTLDTCDKEPIHIPGAVQPHGVLFACHGDDLTVGQVSDNAERVFGEPVAALLGQPLASLLEAASSARVRELATHDELRGVPPFRVVSRAGRAFDAVAHLSGTHTFVLELEPASPGRDDGLGSFDPRLRGSVVRLQNASDVRALTAAAAEEVRSLTGFDRVMVYRFDADWNGEVVAESKIDGIGSFLGQHYPAADIPAQARRLYTINRLRFIADASYQASPLVPAVDPLSPVPLDMSHSILRSVSPIHIEYLKNMGVTASMSISLVIDGELAGLIACHHYSGPRLVPVSARDTAEYLAYALSWQLRVVEGAERAEHARVAQQHEAEVVRSIAIASELLDGLDTPALVSLADATGAAVVLEEGVRRIGRTPPPDALGTLVAWLRQRKLDVYATDHLGEELPAAKDWQETAAGVVAVAIARGLGEYILWFRPAVARVVEWAGKPGKSVITHEGGAPRLSPRGSFEVWREVIEGRSLPWAPWQVDAASSLRRVILGGVRQRAVHLRSINQRLLAADRAKDEFIATVSHELRTPLNAIHGWTNLLKGGDVEPARLQHAVDVIGRNVNMQIQLVEDLLDTSRISSGKLELEVDFVDVSLVVGSAIEAAALAIQAKGLELVQHITPDIGHIRGDALRLRQVVGNLLTNAVKFTPKGGRIDVTLRRDESDVEIVIADNGRGIDRAFVPFLFDAFRQEDPAMNRRSQGLGLGLSIVKKLVELHGGQVHAESAGPGKGATFRVRLPMTAFTPGAVHDRERRPSSDAPAAAASIPPTNELAGVDLLVVEDDPDSRDLLRHLLERRGAKVTAASSARVALDALETRAFDVIVSDVGMPDMDGLELLRTLRARASAAGQRTPAVALTAYTRAADRAKVSHAGFQAHVPKPVDAEELVAILCGVLQRDLPR
jgi:light-regulated signal transduction histidine kinase (bacteriophytochrome)/ActR/RegA family two-component response regulator